MAKGYVTSEKGCYHKASDIAICSAKEHWPSGAAGPPSDDATELEAERFRSIELRQSLDGCTRRVAELAAALASAEQRARTQALDEAAEAVAAEPVLPGEMPPEMADLVRGGMTVDLVTELLRITVRATQNGILSRIRALGASPEGRGSATP
jgi:hypothetical protein